MLNSVLPHTAVTYTAIPSERPNTPLLDRVNNPSKLKQLTEGQLLQLADELRLYLLYAVGQSGGHFGANLGVVELTIALHTVLNAPVDKLVWDVGHQAYAHKVLTGRREALTSIRSKGGLTAFPERSESEYDTFGVGHSSTAISAGLGMAMALRYQGQANKVACVVGDGAMTGGMAFEAMNDAVQHQADLLVVLNDNDMSISCATGGFARHLAALWQSGYQVDITTDGKPELKPRPNMSFAQRKPVADIEDNLFKAIGFNYFGPFDGHDLPEMLRVLQAAKQVKGATLVHVYTTKGKGFSPAEADPIGYHAIAKLAQNQPDKEKLPEPEHIDEAAQATVSQAKKYADVFGEFLCDLAQQDNNMLAITPAMCEGSGMVNFAQRYPKRFFDVAIAEQHAVTLAAGMACEGAKPIVAIYSTFLQRGYDQLIHDVALQNLDVTFAIDRAGLVGEDGATHAGVFDYAFMRCLPNVVICAPKDENECYQLLYTAYMYKGVASVRYPRGFGVGAAIQKPMQALPIGKAEIISELKPQHPNQKTKLALLTFGSMVSPATQAAKQLQADGFEVLVVNMRFVKPLDTGLIQQLYADYRLVTIEEHMLMGGAGSAVNEFIMTLVATNKQPMHPVLNLGIADAYIAHASHTEQLADCGLDADGIYRSIIKGYLKLR